MYTKTQPGLVLATVAIAQLVVALDITVVNIALPQIRGALDFSATALPWVVNAYALAFGGLLLLGGRLGDLLGGRRVLVGALVLFAVASAVGGLAPSAAVLVVARVVQGVAAAALAPTSLSILTTTFPEGRERTRALAVWMIVGVAGSAVGMMVGGVLTQYATWRWVMWINVPIAAAGVALGVRALPRRRDGHHGDVARLDVPGAVLATAGVGLLVLGVVRTDALGWGSATTIGTLAASALLIVAFGACEARVATAPLVRLGVLFRRGPGVANLIVMLVCSAQFASFYFVSIQVQRVMHFSPVATGLAFLPFCVGMVVGSMASMRALPRVGSRALLATGCLIVAGGLAWFSALGDGSTFLRSLLGPMLVMSTGLSLCFVPATAAATAGTAPSEAGMAAGIHNSAKQIGGAIGLAALVTIATAHQHALAAGGATPTTALGEGQARGLLVGALIVAGAALVAAVAAERVAPAPRAPRTPDAGLAGTSRSA